MHHDFAITQWKFKSRMIRCTVMQTADWQFLTESESSCLLLKCNGENNIQGTNFNETACVRYHACLLVRFPVAITFSLPHWHPAIPSIDRLNSKLPALE